MVTAVCKRPVGIQNQFYEFLEFGAGIEPKFNCHGRRANCPISTELDRGDYPTFRDLNGTGRLIRVRALDPLDSQGLYRTLIQGTDTFDNIIYSQDGVNRVTGVYLTLQEPFVDTPMTLNTLTGIQKDVTNGAIQYYDVELLECQSGMSGSRMCRARRVCDRRGTWV
jgi:hypothetical protein